MNRIYISGRVTGLPQSEYLSRFQEAEDFLSQNGYRSRVINPARILAELPPESTTYGDYMRVSMTLLGLCDGIYMLDGWWESQGATLEHDYAISLGMAVLYEPDREEVWKSDGTE